MAVKAIDPGEGKRRFGFAQVDDRKRVIGYQEKPDEPLSNLISLTIYLFKTDVLIQRLEENQRTGRTHQLYSEVLPEMVGRDRVFAYSYEGYWNYARSIASYHQANMDLLRGPAPESAVQPGRWGIRTRRQLRGLGDLPPVRLMGDSACTDSLVSPGVIIEGTVIHSVLSPGVRVEPGARVVDSVIMHDSRIRPGAVVERAVLDKRVEVGREATVGRQSGISVVGLGALIPAGARVGGDCIVHPEVQEEDFGGPVLEDGCCLEPGGKVTS
jgi:glucose-1-phosphate adenylyltransferase